MKRSPRPRRTVKLSDSVEQPLRMYALAAGAAGVGVLGLAQRAEAKIVYTPANVPIVLNAGPIGFDLNHDGISDFALSNKLTVTSATLASLKVVQARQANQIREGACYLGFVCAAALPKGTKIGLKGQFQEAPKSGLYMVDLEHESDWGPWLRVKQAYLGLKFVIKGKTHFGWARVKLNVDEMRRTIAATLTGYAYETIPNKGIIAGATKGLVDAEPAASLNTQAPGPVTLGALALGAPGLSTWRREESVGTPAFR